MVQLDFRILVEAASDPIGVLDREQRLVFANPALARTLGVPAAALVGAPVDRWLEPGDAAAWRDAVAGVLGGGAAEDVEHTLETPRGPRWFGALIGALPGAGACAVWRDITDVRSRRLLDIAARERSTGMGIVEAPSGRTLFKDAEPERGGGANVNEVRGLDHDATLARRAREAAACLARADAVLARFERATSLQAIADLAVPVLADWCFIRLKTDSCPAIAAIAGADPALLAAERARHAVARPPAAGSAIARALAGGPAELVDVDAAVLARAATDPAHLALLRAHGYRSAVVAPMVGRQGVLGTVLFAMAESGRRYAEADLDTLGELARRTGAALERCALTEALRASEEQLALAVDRVREADRRKDEFLAMLGHELRNPLAPIATALELMSLKGGAALQKERDVIRRQVEHLSRLIDDLLDVSRITRGKIQLARQVVEIGAVLARAIETASPLLEKRLQPLAIEVPREGLAVDADPERLAQVFQNLLTNAAKYSEPRAPIGLRARAEGDRVVVEIADRGVGIAEAALPHLFDLFVQGERTIDRSKGGLGIGLTIARSLCELHGGAIRAASEGPGRGSTFTVSLPRAAVGGAPAPPALAGVVAPRGADGARVLVVDDNVDAALLLRELLAGLGHESAVAHDGPAALELVRSFRPDVAVLDIGLPVMDGYELARRLRERLEPARVRLIAVTGYGQDSDRARARAAGFDHHLVKPVAIDVLAPLLAVG